MPSIITTSELQKYIGRLKDLVKRAPIFITNRGKASMVLLPYFEGNDEAIEKYLEDYEIDINAEKLKSEMEESLKSGQSDLVI